MLIRLEERKLETKGEEVTGERSIKEEVIISISGIKVEIKVDTPLTSKC